jgi:hypothetical protein
LQLEVITFQQEILAPQGEVDDDGWKTWLGFPTCRHFGDETSPSHSCLVATCDYGANQWTF